MNNIIGELNFSVKYLSKNLTWIHFLYSMIVFLSNLIGSSSRFIASIGIMEKYVESSVGSIFNSKIEMNIGYPKHLDEV